MQSAGAFGLVLYSILSRVHFFTYALFTLSIELFLISRFIWIGKFFDVVKIKIKLLENYWKTNEIAVNGGKEDDKLKTIIEYYASGLQFAQYIEIRSFS